MTDDILTSPLHELRTSPVFWLWRPPSLYMPKQSTLRLVHSLNDAALSPNLGPALDIDSFVAQLVRHRRAGRLHPKLLRLDDYQTQPMNSILVCSGQAQQAKRISHRLLITASTAAESLTEREQDILRAVAAGLSNTEIAAQCGVTTGTVKWHLNNIYSKLGASRRTQAIAYARNLGYLPA